MTWLRLALRVVCVVGCFAVAPGKAQDVVAFSDLNAGIVVLTKALEELDPLLQSQQEGLLTNEQGAVLTEALDRLVVMHGQEDEGHHSLVGQLASFIKTWDVRADVATWDRIKELVAENGRLANAVADILAPMNASFAYRQVPEYRQFQRFANASSSLYDEIGRMAPLTNEDEIEHLRIIGEDLIELGIASGNLLPQIAEYLTYQEEKANERQAMWQLIAAAACCVVFLVALLVLAYKLRRPTPWQYMASRIILALAATGFVVSLAGLLEVNISDTMKAGAALVVFAIVYLYSPAPLVVQKPAT